ncbi:hypothetical protein B0H21DRAFT_687888 [Amylocystis lapponica]|nr:hypothetical protein B0H21DRAFT_687888 [Amylocystis lapponica]
MQEHTHPASYAPPPGPPPDWEPAPERSHTLGLYNEATDDDYAAAAAFCARHPPEAPRLLPAHVVERIAAEGCLAWTLEPPRGAARFAGAVRPPDAEKGAGAGVVRVETRAACGDACLLSSLPLLAGLYDVRGKEGVYFEVCVRRMDGVLAIGTACRPYPAWRLPGWERHSAALHLDDMRKFCEDADGGRDYVPALRVRAGDTVGCGVTVRGGARVFFTHNGVRLPDACAGVYVPRAAHDVYAALGVSGACAAEVNFGGALFRWKEGNEWAWRVEGHVGRMDGGGEEDALPAYEEAPASGSG